MGRPLSRRGDGSLPGDLLLQRRLPGDAAKWRTVTAFALDQAAPVQRAAETLAAINPTLAWRVVDACCPLRVVAHWDGARWV